MFLLSLLGAVGCGPAVEEEPGLEELSTREGALKTGTGLPQPADSTNGLSVNGLSVNGLSVNGLSVNGLSVNGLQSSSFRQWFEKDPARHATVMRYVVLCAVPSGQVRTYVSQVSGASYSWMGSLGLAPQWAGGAPATVAEQQIISACLAAHANKYGMQIPLSVKGLDALGTAIPFTTQELASYPEEEACFFGNLFNGEGIFAVNNRSALDEQESTARACGLSTEYASFDCAPITHLQGRCADYCAKGSSSHYYTQCSYQGVTYRPLTTALRMKDIYRCGDGVCQFTESCGNSTSYNNCMPDCGFCP